MGVHKISSEAAKYYALREKVIGSAISLLSEASMNLDKLNKIQLEKLGNLAAKLVPHSPGYVGKLMPTVARLFWKLSEVSEREFSFVELSQLEIEIEELKKEIKI
ncbi:MAG: hypothetical protein RMH75_03955 [Archaeoglobaceae archaeon]|nr:hypothetical protein [Archaeoglobaceae archaeon]